MPSETAKHLQKYSSMMIDAEYKINNNQMKRKTGVHRPEMTVRIDSRPLSIAFLSSPAILRTGSELTRNDDRRKAQKQITAN